MAALFALTSLFVAVEVLSVKLAEVTLFVIVILPVIAGVQIVLRTRQSFASVTPSLYRVEETIVSAREAREEDFGTLAMSELRQSIRLESATYKYEDSHSRLSVISSLNFLHGKLLRSRGHPELANRPCRSPAQTNRAVVRHGLL